MAGKSKSFWAPREKRGLPQKVFFDPSKKRASRILYSATALVLLGIGWVVFFAVALLSTQRSAVALSDDLNWLKGYLASPSDESRSGALNAANKGHPAVDGDTKTAGAPQGCVSRNSAGRRKAPRIQVYAVLPSETPFAPQSLRTSCNTVDVLMPSWFTVELSDDRIMLSDVGKPAQQPIWEFFDRNAEHVQIMPIVTIGTSAKALLQTRDGRTKIQTKVISLSDQLSQDERITGLCLELEGDLADSFSGAKLLFEPLATRFAANGLNSCVAFAAGTAPNILKAADETFDFVIAKGFRVPWLGSIPHPLSADEFFTKEIAHFQAYVSPEKLIFGLGTHSVDWVSGKPMPNVRPYADVMEAVGDAGRQAKFIPEVGNSYVELVDKDGLQHRVWMADVASALNQTRMLQEAGIANVALWGLGYEDPGVWSLLEQLKYSETFDPTSVSKVILDGFVSYSGKGPFVAPLALPTVGERALQIDPTSRRVESLEYSRVPRPSSVHLYGDGFPGQVVLTFDDGPHPDYTTPILSILQEMDVPGSFFVLGHNALKSPEIVNQILEGGHELGSHTYWHPKMSSVSEARARAEVNSVQNLIAGITGRQMKLYREPYMRSGGPISAQEVSSLLPLERAGYLIAGMDIVPRDWTDQTPQELAREIISQVEAKGGGVVLLHDGGGDQSATVAALPIVIDTLREKGFRFISLAKYLGTSTDALMPAADPYASAFHGISYNVVGGSWKFLEIVFWVVFAIGLARAMLTLILSLRRRPHAVSAQRSCQTATVVVPAYNEEAVLEQCLLHVLESDYPHFDVVVVDDGSTDGTLEIARQFEKSPRVTVITQRNGGKSSALNAALDATDSEVLICIDADSQIHRKAISRLMAHFEDPEIGAVAGRIVVGNRKNLLTGLQALEYITAQSIDRRAKELFNAISVVPGALGAWRTNSVLEAGIFSSETLTEDADMTMAVIRSGYRVIYEENAVATTEAPASLSGLTRQRLRWNLGMMQASWKHLGSYAEGRALGFIALTDLLVFGYLMPLLAPLADILLVILVAGSLAELGGNENGSSPPIPAHLLFAYLLLPALDLFLAFVAFWFDPREDRRLLLLLPFQRLLYRPLLYISVYKSIWRALTGSLAKWGTIGRAGYRFDHEKVA